MIPSVCLACTTAHVHLRDKTWLRNKNATIVKYKMAAFSPKAKIRECSELYSVPWWTSCWNESWIARVYASDYFGEQLLRHKARTSTLTSKCPLPKHIFAVHVIVGFATHHTKSKSMISLSVRVVSRHKTQVHNQQIEARRDHTIYHATSLHHESFNLVQ